jgi:hypothetical protein
MQLPQDFLDLQESIEREVHQVWTPHAGQMPIICDFLIHWRTGVFVQCGRKWGKTEAAIYLCYMFALLFPGAEIYYVADEKDHARDICWDNGRLPYFLTRLVRGEHESQGDFETRCRKGRQLEKRWIDGVNNAEMKIRFRNGSVVKVEGAKNFTIADGLSPTFVVYDEFKDHDRRFDERMRPNLMARKGRILIIGTPPGNKDNYYCSTAEEFKSKREHSYYLMPCYLNPIVYPGGESDSALIEEMEAYRKKGELHVFKREYLAQITPDQTRVIFPMFDRLRHIRPHQELIDMIKRSHRDWELYSSFDPGTTSVFANLQVAIHKHSKLVLLINEIYEKQAMQTYARNIYTRSKTLRDEVDEFDGHWVEIYDHAAAWFQVEIAQEFGVGLMPCTKDMKNKEAKLSVIKDALLYDRLLVSDRCVNAIWEIENYAKDENGKIPKENDHCLTGDSIVSTENGDRRLDSITAGDMVLTRRGYRRVLKFWDNGMKSVIPVHMSNGMSIELTEDHLVYVRGKGYTPACQLVPGDFLWSSKDVFIESGERAPITDMGSVHLGLDTFTGTFGSTTMAPYQKAWTFITKMAILATTRLKTWRQSARKITPWSTLNRAVCSAFSMCILGIWTKSEKSPRHGIGLRRVANGTLRTQERLSENTVLGIATIAQRDTGTIQQLGPDSAQTTANLLQEGCQGLMTSKDFASGVVPSSQLINTQEQDAVRVLAVGPCLGQKNVYDLTVDGEHEYFANGILVHNCIDNLRYIMNQASYNSVPREPVNLDEVSGRRYHTIESDIAQDRQSLALLGGIDDLDLDDDY